MRTLIVSDLHLGSAGGSDLLRSPHTRAPLLEALNQADRLVLLGDALELRHGPAHVAMAAARPFFEDLGVAMAGREIVIVPGNHDHVLIAPWLERRGEDPSPARLTPEQRLAPEEGSPILQALAEWASPAILSVAYPGVWIRPDVYAIHGHYLDCHLTIPTMERIAIGATGRVLGRRSESLRGVEDHEAVSAPVFAWIDAIATNAPAGTVLNGSTTVRMWHALGGSNAPKGARRLRGRTGTGGMGGLRRGARRRALMGAFPLAVAALNRAGLGPLRANISAVELRRAGLRAMGEVAARLDLGDAHVVFGHTHRAGPLPGDDPTEWVGRLGARLTNTGSWTYSHAFLTAIPGESPYWPGSCVIVDDSGPPVVSRLLVDRTHAELVRA